MAITRLGQCGGPRGAYGSFAGKTENVSVPGRVFELPAVFVSTAARPGIVRTTDARPAVFRSTEEAAGLL